MASDNDDYLNNQSSSLINEKDSKKTSLLADNDLHLELLEAFKGELDEYLQVLNRDLIQLEQGSYDENVLKEIFRTAHSMKGTAGAFGLPRIQKVSHSLENLFGAVRNRKFMLEKAAFDLCYEGLDLISQLMETELAGVEAPADIEIAYADRINQLLQAQPGNSDNQQATRGLLLNSDQQNNNQQSRLNQPTAELPPLPAPETNRLPPIDSIIKPTSESESAAQLNYPESHITNETAKPACVLVNDDMREELLVAFKSELDEYLQVLNRNLIMLEQNGFDENILKEIFRTAHSMKGTAGAFGLPRIQKVSHSLENLFGSVRSRKFTLDNVAFDLCYDGLDLISKLMETELSGVQAPADVENNFAAQIDRLLHAQGIVASKLQKPTQTLLSSEAASQPSHQTNNPVNNPVENLAFNQTVDHAVDQTTDQSFNRVINQDNKRVINQGETVVGYVPDAVPTVMLPETSPVTTAPPASAETAAIDSNEGTKEPACVMVNDEMREELLTAFKSELDEYLQVLNRNLIMLEQNGLNENILKEIFRTAHSMKGTAAAFGLPRIQKVSHSLENLFGVVRQHRHSMGKAAFDLCYEGLDLIGKLMETELAGVEAPFDVEADFARRMNLLLNNEPPVQQPTVVGIAPPLLSPPVFTSAAPPSAIPSDSILNNQIAVFSDQIAVFNDQRLQRLEPPQAASLQKSEAASLQKTEAPELPAKISNQMVQSIHTTEAMAPTRIDNVDNKQLTTVGNKALEPTAKTEFIRIPLPKIDQLMSEVGELLIARSRYEQRLNEIQNIGNELYTLFKDMMRLRPMFAKNPGAANHMRAVNHYGDGMLDHNSNGMHDKQIEGYNLLFDSCQTRVKNLNSMVQLHTENFSNDDLHLELLISGIQQEVQGLRMLPIDTLFEPLRRRARDIARKQDKNVILEFDGGETELDRQLIEAMRDPLVHLITNSIDHGLEIPSQRERMGKNPNGSLRLTAGQRGNQILIEIVDDGAGIDLARVREKAISAGLYTERELELLNDQETLSIIFRPGFSTRAAVTEISGRGVGLDVVKVSVEKLQGQIEVMTAPGRGTTFRITLPLTLSTQRVLTIKCANQLFVLPVNAIERVMNVPTEDVFTVGARMVISLDGKPISLLALDELLGIAPPQQDHSRAECLIMIINLANERVAFLIEDVIGEQEMVVKSLGKPLRRMKNIAGGVILGDGSVVLLLNPADLVRSLRNNTARLPQRLLKGEEQPTKQKRRILVVDDSITTRTLEKNILEMAGYEVLLAKDGAEGLELARTSNCQLVISDVEMPRLNGFELISLIKNDVQLKRLPCVLVSSLDSQQDKARGAQAGADAYIVKGQFDQKDFLEVVENMLAL